MYTFLHDPYSTFCCFSESDGRLGGTNLKFFNLIAEKLKLKPKFHVLPGGYIDRKTGRLKGGPISHVRFFFLNHGLSYQYPLLCELDTEWIQ